MGGTVDIFPNAVVTPPTAGWVATGGTTVTAVTDASDASYISDTTPGSTATKIQWTLTDTALATGAAVKYAYPMVRYSQAAGTTALAGYLTAATARGTYSSPRGRFTPSSSIQENNLPTGGAVPQATSQEMVNNAKLTIEQYLNTKVADDHRVYRAWMRIQYVDSPTASAVALVPSNANTLTTRPAATWAYDSVDGLAQYEYRVALWKLSDINLFPGGRTGFETDPDPYVFGSGFLGTDSQMHYPKWTSGGWVKSADTQVQPDKDIDGSSAYVYYVQVSALHAGERLAHPFQFGSLDFTQSITIPTVPTSVTPTWASSTWTGSISVVYPAQTLGSWNGRRLIVQARDSGSTDESSWRTLPQGTSEIGAGSGTIAFSDPYIYAGQSKTYRAMTLLYTTTGYSSGSAWVTSSNIVGVYDRFVLRDPYDWASATECKILGDFQASHDEIQGSFRPLGSRFPVVVSDALIGRRWNVEVLVRTQAISVKLDTLREAMTPLVLHSDMPFQWYWVRIGPQVQKRLIRQPGRVTESTRSQIWQMELIEVAPPPNQPNGGT
jgi:hypothetical protein